VAAVKKGCQLYKDIKGAAGDVKAVLKDLDEQFHGAFEAKGKTPTVEQRNQFVKENIELSNSSARIYIDSDEAEMFTTEPALQKLVSDRKVSLLPPELYFEAEDKSTIEILKGYFPDVDFEDDFEDEEEDDSDEFYDDDFGFESPFCKGCKGTGCEECDGSGMKRNSI
jgi:hypothetical protein